MEINKKLDALRSGHLSRRDFNKTLAAVGVSVVAMPVASKLAAAAAADQATYFTWGGYDVPDMFGPYIKTHGEPPN